MSPITTHLSSSASRQSASDADLQDLLSQMTCACAQTSAHADAPLAQALFHRVDVKKYPMGQAARALGIAPGDAAYLLAGLRKEIAKDFATVMLTGHPCAQRTDEVGSADV